MHPDGAMIIEAAAWPVRDVETGEARAITLTLNTDADGGGDSTHVETTIIMPIRTARELSQRLADAIEHADAGAPPAPAGDNEEATS